MPSPLGWGTSQGQVRKLCLPSLSVLPTRSKCICVEMIYSLGIEGSISLILLYPFATLGQCHGDVKGQYLDRG